MDVIAHYNRLIEENNDPFRDPPELRAYMDRWDGPRFLEAMDLDTARDVLEIGIGTGRLAARVAPLCRTLTGIDVSPKTIARAGENLIDFGNIELICADFAEYPFRDQYHVIYSSLTMMHFEDKAGFLAKAASLLRPGGVFCLSIDKNQDNFIDMGVRKLRIYPDDPRQTVSLAEAAGLRVTDTFETELAHILVFTK